MKKITLVMSLLATVCGSAFAADGTINFNGTIISSACTLDTTSASTVSMGNILASSFSSAGSTAGATQFSIKFSSCPKSITAANIRFDGPVDTSNNALLALSPGQTATNLGVGIYESNSNKQIPIGTNSADISLSSTADTTVTYIAKYVATGTGVTAGTANASATFTVAYQ